MATKATRRVLLGGSAAIASVTTAGYFAYRAFPAFWNQYIDEMKIPIEPAPETPDPRSWPDTGLHAAWLGHSTVLVKLEGFTFLTDPVFSDRAGLSFGPVTLGLKRIVAPALRIDQLPPIDLVLVSHAHMDHLDVPSLRKLESKRTKVVMASRISDLIRAHKYAEVRELGWDEEFLVGPAFVKAFQVRHWGARMRTDTYRGYNGYVIEVAGRRVLFAGDTALTDTFRAVKRRPGIDLAIMPIGAYNPWIGNHCNPEQAWRMANDAGAEFVLPVHHQTFRLSREPHHEPIERLLTAAGSHHDRVALRRVGSTFRI